METKNCKHCNKEFEVNSKNRRNLFCNSSCAGSYNNKKRAPQSEETKNKISETLKNKWAESRELFSTGDNHSKKVGNSTKGKFKKNVETIYELSKRTVQKILKRLNLGCSNCGWNQTTCDIHHINGRKIEDCDNHNNLSLLCPNCHRMAHEGKLKKENLKNLNSTLPDNWKESYYG
jgi:predicted HNH restriction endonuclease